MTRRVLVIGLDCASPNLVFDRWRDAMPRCAALMDHGTWGPLRSTVPPITVPAWMSMATGRDPGELGLYGFRNRRRGEYGLHLATSADVRAKRVWDRLGEAGKRVAALFVPLTYPPVPLRGQLVSGPLTPGGDVSWAFPPSLKQELSSRFGPYRPDVEHVRTEDLDTLWSELHETATQHFDMARYVWETKRPDFMMMVEIGTDRLHHACWHHVDPSHPKYEPDNPWESRARDYYAMLDRRIGELIDAADDDVTVLVVSDHGARPMQGGLRINEWLQQRGWLVLRTRPAQATPLSEADVDWARTRAWGEGGYYARICLNVRGREPEGCLDPERYETERQQLAHELASMPGPDGELLGNEVFRPEPIYRQTRGMPPDLLVYPGGLDWRSLGTVGGDETVYAELDDRGPDACNHDPDGIFLMSGGGAPAHGRVEGLSIYDVGRTVLGLMDVEPMPDMHGIDRSRDPERAP